MEYKIIQREAAIMMQKSTWPMTCGTCDRLRLPDTDGTAVCGSWGSTRTLMQEPCVRWVRCVGSDDEPFDQAPNSSK